MNTKKIFFLIVGLVFAAILFSFFDGQRQSAYAGTDVAQLILTPTALPGEIESFDEETVSIEDEEAIKKVIQSYFETRYSLLSASRSADFQQNIFGGLISETKDVSQFLGDETDKLALERKHAEINRLLYADYKYSLNFDRFILDKESGMVSVTVVENNEVVYELSKDLDPQNPVSSYHANIQHDVILFKEQGSWKIVSDNYEDMLWKIIRQTGKPAEEMLNNLTAAQAYQPEPSVMQSAPSNNLSADPSSYNYDRAGVVDYALQHYNAYNPNYTNYDGVVLGGDCTNFISQAIYEGSNASMALQTPLPLPSTGGNIGWYYFNELQHASAWTHVEYFYEFVTDTSDQWKDGPEGIVVQNINQLMVGDVIQYDWTGNGSWDHAVLVSKIIQGIPYVVGHSRDIANDPYNSLSSYNPEESQVRFIHIRYVA